MAVHRSLLTVVRYALSAATNSIRNIVIANNTIRNINKYARGISVGTAGNTALAAVPHDIVISGNTIYDVDAAKFDQANYTDWYGGISLEFCSNVFVNGNMVTRGPQRASSLFGA